MRRLALAAAIIAAIALGGCGGCGGPSAETANREAEAFCANHGGVDHINFDPTKILLYPATFDAECIDGSEIE